jgi:hypothetical protein
MALVSLAHLEICASISAFLEAASIAAAEEAEAAPTPTATGAMEESSGETPAVAEAAAGTRDGDATLPPTTAAVLTPPGVAPSTPALGIVALSSGAFAAASSPMPLPLMPPLLAVAGSYFAQKTQQKI